MANPKMDTAGLLLLLHHVLLKVGLDAIPPATFVLVAAQACVFLRLFDLPWSDPSEVCISVETVLFKREWWRIFYGAIEHADSLHLYYNMVSFIWKGMILEDKVGSVQFTFIVSFFTALCGAVLIVMNCVLGEVVDGSFYYYCGVGFSGVIFALKVLNNHDYPGQSRRVFGFEVTLPSGFFVWAEPLLIQLISSDISFLAHLAGVLAGLAYVYVIKPAFSVAWRVLVEEPMLAMHQEVIPYGSILLLLVLLAVHGDLLPEHWTKDATCLTCSPVIEERQWRLLFLPALHCTGPWHLIYTVVSLLGLGYHIERRVGSVRFLSEMAVLVFATNLAFCAAIHYLLPDNDESGAVTPNEMKRECVPALTAAIMGMKGLYRVPYLQD
ncbi:hypothetical protein V5799_016946, partial [Amblyomma americanum]